MSLSDTGHPFSKRFARLIIEHPWRSLLAGLVLLMAALPGGQYIKADFSYRVWFDPDDPLLVQFDKFERRFGNDESVMVIVHSPSGIFDRESIEALTAFTERLWQVNSVIRVDSLSNFNWVHAEEDDVIIEPLIPEESEEWTPELLAQRKAVALAHETLPGYMVSKDAKTTVLFAALRPGIPEFTDYKVVVEDVRGAMAEFAERGGDHVYMAAGQPVISHSFRQATETDLKLLVPIVFGLTVLFLALIFRRFSGVVLPLVVIGTTVAATMTMSGWFRMSLNNLTTIVPQVLLAIAVADSVHILTTFYRAMRRGADRRTAARHSLEKNFQPTLVTSISTSIGFLSFSTAAVVPIAQLGILAGIGTLVAWLMSYLVLGPLMVLLPIRQPKAPSEKVDLMAPSERGVRIAHRIQRRRGPILGAFLAIAVVFGIFAAETEVNSDPLTYFPEGSELNVASTFIEEHLGGSIAIEIVVDSGVEEGIKAPEFLRQVDTFQAWIEALPYTTSVTSVVDILKSMNRSLNGDDPAAYKLPDTRDAVAQEYLLYTMGLPQGMDLNDRVALRNDALRMTAMWNIHDSKRVLEAIDLVEARARELGLNAHVTGKVPIWQRMNPYVVNTFVTSLLVAILLMSLLLIVVFRSVRLGLLALIPNGAPLVLGAGLLAAMNTSLDIGGVIVFSVCLGIAVDDTVHFLSSFNRLRRAGHNAHDAIARTFTHTMPALFFTTVILVVAFGIFAFAQFIPNRFFGIMVAFILSLALISDATLLPALLIGSKDNRNSPRA